MPRRILVLGQKRFRITVPDDAKLTFGPFSPPTSETKGRYDESARRGTLRIYQGTEKNILAVFAGVDGFRDLSLGYEEEVAREEGAVIWKDDEKGYSREDKVTRQKTWVTPEIGTGEEK